MFHQTLSSAQKLYTLISADFLEENIYVWKCYADKDDQFFMQYIMRYLTILKSRSTEKLEVGDQTAI